MIAAPDAAAGDESFRLLVICTANLCRSPMAEHMLRQSASTRGLDWIVDSAGVLARPGQPMHPWAAEMLAERSLSPEGWRSRRLERPMIERADLILTAASEHRQAVVVLSPRAAGRTFNLLQFARLVSSAGPIIVDSPARAGAEMLERVARVRAHLQPIHRGRDDDVSDPIGMRHRAFNACASQLQAAIDRLLAGVQLP